MHMNGYSKIEALLETFSKEQLFDELMQWLTDEAISDFADDFKTNFADEDDYE